MCESDAYKRIEKQRNNKKEMQLKEFLKEKCMMMTMK